MVDSSDIQYIEKAIEVAANSKSTNPDDPYVGAVLVKGTFVENACRGELADGDHAEFTLLEKKLPGDYVRVPDSTLYTTLEPCTKRSEKKTPCADRIKERKIKRVVIGILDPNQDICGKGVRALRNANIEVDLFPREYMTQVESQNRRFIAFQEKRSALANVPPVIGLTLDEIVLEPCPGWTFKFKLRIFWTNDGDESHLGKARWIPGGSGIQGHDLMYRYQVWENSKWGDELEEVNVLPNQRCRIFVALDPSEKNVEMAPQLLQQGRLGTLTIPVTPKARRLVELRIRPRSPIYKHIPPTQK